MTQIWLITATPDISNLLDLASGLGPVTAVAVGTEAAGVDRLITIALDNQPAEAAGPAVADAVTAGPGDIILIPNRSAERALAGAVAARLNAPVLSGVTAIGENSVTRSRYGGLVTETVSFTSPVVVVADGGMTPGGDTPGGEPFTGELYPAVVTGESTAQADAVNLTAAKKIVAVGRGFKAEEDLKLAEDFARAIGAEIACSRPLSEGTEWLPRDRYIGITGQHVAPEVYVAIGISGQMQHTAGMVNSGTVIAINNDDKSLIFSQADYGIVGDLYEVLPELTKALQ